MQQCYPERELTKNTRFKTGYLEVQRNIYFEVPNNWWSQCRIRSPGGRFDLADGERANWPYLSDVFYWPRLQTFFEVSWETWGDFLECSFIMDSTRESRPGYPKSDPDPWAGPGSKMGPNRVKIALFWLLIWSKFTHFSCIFRIDIGTYHFLASKQVIISKEWKQNISLKNLVEKSAIFSTKFLDPDSDPDP